MVITQSNKKKLVVNWFSSIKEIDGGIWAFSFDHNLRPYLLKLKQEFTNYQLKDVIRLNSKYAIRLYELLKQYLSIGERIIKISDLRLILGIEKKQYYRFNDFKRNVIEKAKVELSQKTDIQFTWQSVKTVRKITAIHFFIKKNKFQRNKQPKSNEICKLINLIPKKNQKKRCPRKTNRCFFNTSCLII